MKISAFLLVAMLAVTALFADDDDPPSRVARLNYVSGPVSFRPGEADDWTDAHVNRPLTRGDHLWTDDDARAELHIGSTALRLGPNTAFSFLNLDDRMTQMRVTDGSVNVRINHLYEDEAVEIDTPDGAVSLLREGVYRVDVSNEQTTLTVRHGEAEVTADGSAVPVRAHERLILHGSDSDSREGGSYDIQDERDLDSFDEWADARDHRDDRSESRRYMSAEVTGYEDLDENGSWSDEGEYGRVWMPSHVAVDWAPYHYGHWAWLDPWGWTWVDDASWGFAPFHYGRWASFHGRWGWVPGSIVERPVYAPALVAFLNVGPLHIALTDGMAWVPLGPREVYYPSYHVSRHYVEQVNVTHVNVTQINVTNVNVTNVYVNQSVQGGVVACPREHFVGARSVASGAVVVSAKSMANVRMTPVRDVNVVVKPRRESVLGGAVPTGRTVHRPPDRVMERQVVARVQPPAGPAMKFTGGGGGAGAGAHEPKIRSAVLPVGAAGGGGGGHALKPARQGLATPEPVHEATAPKHRAGHEPGGDQGGTGGGGAGKGGQATPEPTRAGRGDHGGRPTDAPTGRRGGDPNDRPHGHGDKATPEPTRDRGDQSHGHGGQATPEPTRDRSGKGDQADRPRGHGEQPTSEPTREHRRENTPQPTSEPPHEHRRERTPEPTSEPTREHRRENTPQPTSEPAREHRRDNTPAPTSEPQHERHRDKTPEPTPEPQRHGGGGGGGNQEGEHHGGGGGGAQKTQPTPAPTKEPNEHKGGGGGHKDDPKPTATTKSK